MSLAGRGHGDLSLSWSPNGTTSLLATTPLPYLRGRAAVRAVLDTDNGTGGWTVSFYLAAVAAISGTSSPQRFTVLRARNAVAKSHPASTALALPQPAIAAL
ncbi:hypothetical protein ACZ90_38405 [Streptomyces albus subsp. albus]|nr:hypothetical protein ACZ90_38405 [Streptomyces albus subsp. albus]